MRVRPRATSLIRAAADAIAQSWLSTESSTVSWTTHSAKVPSTVRTGEYGKKSSPSRYPVTSPLKFSTKLPKDPGVIRHFIDSFFPIKGTDGKAKAVGAVVLDITARKEAEEALQRSHAELEQRIEERTAQLTHSIRER